MTNLIKPPELSGNDIKISNIDLIESLNKAIESLVSKAETLAIFKQSNPNNSYVSNKLKDIREFSINLTSIVLIHDPHTFFSGRSLESVKTLLVENADTLNVLMTVNHFFYSNLSIKDITVKQAVKWFAYYYSSMQMTENKFNILSQESVNVINEPKAEELVLANTWLLLIFLLVINPKLVDKLIIFQ